VVFGVGIETEADADPDSDPDADKPTQQNIFMHLGATPVHGRLARNEGLEEAELEFRGFGHHAGVPGRVPHEDDFGAGHARNHEDLAFNL
jgi:hypothetical protein